jgi:hypothetical protein
MKYLHSGYILFCERAEFTDNGRVDAFGLFDLFVEKSLPIKLNCAWVIGFGTPYERRQYKGEVLLENPDGEIVFKHEFQANDPGTIYKGHYILRPEISLDKEGLWAVKVTLNSWKDEPMWDVQRQFWAMIEGDAPPDP